MDFRERPLAIVDIETTAEFFGVPPEPDVHRALNGAETALAVLRKLKK